MQQAQSVGSRLLSAFAGVGALFLLGSLAAYLSLQVIESEVEQTVERTVTTEDSTFSSVPEQLNSSLVDDEFWAPRRGNRWSGLGSGSQRTRGRVWSGPRAQHEENDDAGESVHEPIT